MTQRVTMVCKIMNHSTIYFDYKNYNLYYLVQFSNCFMMLILYLPYKNF